MNKSVYIVAGGTSLKDFNFSKLKNKDVIAVNKSILDVPFAQRFITMDYTFLDHIERKTNNKLNRQQFAKLPCRKFFVVAKDNNYIKFKNNSYVDIRSNYIYDLKEFDEIIVSHKALGFGENFYEFSHGCNSGYSSIQLAIILGYTEIYLLGIDLNVTDTTHYHEGYNQNKNKFEEKLNFYYKYYIMGLHNLRIKFPNIKIYSCSKQSKLNNLIEYKSLEEIT